MVTLAMLGLGVKTPNLVVSMAAAHPHVSLPSWRRRGGLVLVASFGSFFFFFYLSMICFVGDTSPRLVSIRQCMVLFTKRRKSRFKDTGS
jgi:hypothetical protein